jgi:hypothetical protein
MKILRRLLIGIPVLCLALILTTGLVAKFMLSGKLRDDVLSMAQSRLPVAMEIESGHPGFDPRPQEGSGEAAAALAISPASVSGSASRNGGADVNPRAPREKPVEEPRRANPKTRSEDLGSDHFTPYRRS